MMTTVACVLLKYPYFFVSGLTTKGPNEDQLPALSMAYAEWGPLIWASQTYDSTAWHVFCLSIVLFNSFNFFFYVNLSVCNV